MLLLFLVRPEMPIVLPCVLIGYLILLAWQRLRGVQSSAQAKQLRRVVILLVCAAGLIASVLFWRFSYFGSAFPQPVTAKSGDISISYEVLYGIVYWGFTIINAANYPLAIIGIWKILSLLLLVYTLIRKPPVNPVVNAVIAFVGVYSAFIIFSGGDWMPYGRFVVPIDGLMILLAVYITLDRFSGTPFAERNVLVIAALMIVVGAIAVWVYDRASLAPLRNAEELEVVLEDQFTSERYSWFEVVNPVNRRDIITLYYLEETATQLHEELDRPLNLMSLQMGLIPYYLMQDMQGQISLFDRGGLADRRVTDCALTDEFLRNYVGVNLHYEGYMPIREALQEECDIPIPDLIYDLQLFVGTEDAVAALETAGYTRVFLQYEGVPTDEGGAAQAIWIRDEYVPYLDTPSIEIDLEEYGFIGGI